MASALASTLEEHLTTQSAQTRYMGELNNFVQACVLPYPEPAQVAPAQFAPASPGLEHRPENVPAFHVSFGLHKRWMSRVGP